MNFLVINKIHCQNKKKHTFFTQSNKIDNTHIRLKADAINYTKRL